MFIAHDLLVIRHTSGRVAVMYLGVVVEEGIADEIFANLVHPYVEIIWSAIPVPDPTLCGKRNCIITVADLPSLLHPAKGCLFCYPLPIGRTELQKLKPQFIETSPRHQILCPVRVFQ